MYSTSLANFPSTKSESIAPSREKGPKYQRTLRAALRLTGIAIATLYAVPASAGTANCTAHDAAAMIVQRSGGNLLTSGSDWIVKAGIDGRNFTIDFTPNGECSSTWSVQVVPLGTYNEQRKIDSITYKLDAEVGMAMSTCNPNACLAAAQQVRQAAQNEAAAKAKAAADAEAARSFQAAEAERKAAEAKRLGELKCAQFTQQLTGRWTEYDSGRPLNQWAVENFEYKDYSGDCVADVNFSNGFYHYGFTTDRVNVRPSTGQMWTTLPVTGLHLENGKLCYSEGNERRFSDKNVTMQGDGCMVRDNASVTQFYVSCRSSCTMDAVNCNDSYNNSPVCDTNFYLCKQACQ